MTTPTDQTAKPSPILIDMRVGLVVILAFAASVGAAMYQTGEAKKAVAANCCAIATLRDSQFQDRIELAKISTKLSTIEAMICEMRMDMKRSFSAAATGRADNR